MAERKTVIQRWAVFPWVTVGEITVVGTSFRGATLELPWRDNQPDVSCILHGVYKIVRDTFRGKYVNYRIVDVPGRESVEIHRGNTLNDTRGCPLIGTSVMLKTSTEYAYLSESARAFEAWMVAMGGAQEATLEIREPFR